MNYAGQRLLLSEWAHFYPQVDLKNAQKMPAMQQNGSTITCLRCQSSYEAAEVLLPAGFHYCPNCLFLTRVTSDQNFYYFPSVVSMDQDTSFTWSGQLTSAQTKIAQQLKAAREDTLLWAVTGAGKTEMLYPVLRTYLAEGKKILLTALRVDVCNELYLRLSAVWQKLGISLYHGQKRISQSEQLVIATVQQSLRFYHYFDLVILDEVDAFPYATDPLLQAAVLQAKSPTGRMIYLTATPAKQLLTEIPLVLRLPARFHRRKLPVPQRVFCWNLSRTLAKGRLPKKALAKIVSCLAENDVLLFCPSIQLLERLEKGLADQFPEITLTSVHAKDDERITKVEQMRKGGYQLLLTTTILERGVTFERVSVIILQAEHSVFTKASLVQIAGRADRKGTYTRAQVYFVIGEQTRAIQAAIHEIVDNNRLASQQRLVDEM